MKKILLLLLVSGNLYSQSPIK